MPGDASGSLRRDTYRHEHHETTKTGNYLILRAATPEGHCTLHIARWAADPLSPCIPYRQPAKTSAAACGSVRRWQVQALSCSLLGVLTQHRTWHLFEGSSHLTARARQPQCSAQAKPLPVTQDPASPAPACISTASGADLPTVAKGARRHKPAHVARHRVGTQVLHRPRRADTGSPAAQPRARPCARPPGRRRARSSRGQAGSSTSCCTGKVQPGRKARG